MYPGASSSLLPLIPQSLGKPWGDFSIWTDQGLGSLAFTSQPQDPLTYLLSWVPIRPLRMLGFWNGCRDFSSLPKVVKTTPDLALSACPKGAPSHAHPSCPWRWSSPPSQAPAPRPDREAGKVLWAQVLIGARSGKGLIQGHTAYRAEL